MAEKKVSIMSKLKLIFALLNKREKRQLIFVFMALMLSGFMEVVGVGSISPFMSLVSNPEVISSNTVLNWVYQTFQFSDVTSFIFYSGLAVILFIALNNVVRAGISFIIHYYSGKRLHSVSMRLLERYLHQPYVYFLNINTADLSKNILSEVANFINRVLIIFLQLLANAVISLSIIVLLIAINPIFAFSISVGLTLVYLIIFVAARKILSKLGEERAKVNSEKYKYVSEAFGGIKDVKLLGRENVFLNLFKRPSLKYAMNDAISEVIGEAPKYLLETIAFGGLIGLILFLLSRGNNINDFLPLVTVYAFGGYRLLPALQKVFNAIAKIRYHLPVVEILFNDYSSFPSHLLEEDHSENVAPLAFSDSIRLEGIRFSYPGSEKEIIKNQTIEIKSNTSVGFVGPTGCGKTTIVDILLGLLEPQSGSLVIDGKSVTSSQLKAWQKNLGYVPQSIYLIDDTIERNIAFGIPDNEIDYELVVQAAKIANLHEFIENEMEKKYKTIVGERGVRLSGGQRQRIGIARAVYRNPSVLVLDEATSALDGITEIAIMDAIRNLSHKKTIIMIAHRLTTVKECDEIFIMENGRIVDSGSYDELLERNDKFRKMAKGPT